MSNPTVSFNEQAVRDDLRELVRKTIGETINAMLDEEADQLVGAAPYEQTDERTAYRTNNAIERLNREIRRRTRVVGTFPDGKSALMLVAARLKYVADSEWGSRRCLDVSLLKE